MLNNLHFITGHNLAPIDYHSALQTMRTNGFDIDIASPQWSNSFEDIVNEAQRRVNNTPGERPIVIGHGKGGDLAVGAASCTYRELGGLIIASPGALCAEAMKYPEAAATLAEHFPGKPQQDDISRYSIKDLAKQVDLRNDQIRVLVGEREVKAHPYIGELAEITAAAFNERDARVVGDSRVTVTVVPGAPYLMELSPPYINHLIAAAFMIYEAGQNL